MKAVNEIPGLRMPRLLEGRSVKAGGGSFMDMAAHNFAAIEWKLTTGSNPSLRCSQNRRTSAEKAETTRYQWSGSLWTYADIAVSFTQITPPFNSLEIYGTRAPYSKTTCGISL
jgi:hypothetical protein